MGFFNKNYSKEGKGVSKNAPQKRRFFLFWELFGRKFSKIIQVNLLFILFSVPIVTIGPATAGYTYVLRNFAREDHSFVWWDFIDTFKKNFKQGFVAGIIDLIFTFLLVYNALFYWSLRETTLTVSNYFLLAFSITAFVLFLFVRYYVYTIMVTFDLKLRYIYKDALIFAVAGLKNNICALLSHLVTLVIYVGSIFLAAQYATQGVFLVIFVIWFLIFALFLPAFMQFTAIFSTYPVIQKYMMPKTEEPEEKREEEYSSEDIDLIIEEDDDEIIFHDEV